MRLLSLHMSNPSGRVSGALPHSDRTFLWLAYAAAVLCFVDGLMTLPYWHLEGNPVVLALGPERMLLAKSAVLGMIYLWVTSVRGSRFHRVGQACILFLFVLYAAVVGTNLLVLTL